MKEAAVVSPLVEVNNVTLHVPVYLSDERHLMISPRRLLTDLYTRHGQRTLTTILEAISFSLMPGERIGLIGANGAGKSTLLRVLAGIYVPSEGTVAVHGTARGLFDISLGMHMDATGLENIYLRGLQMGLSLKQTKAHAEEVMDFAELGDAIIKPLSTYSTGMRLRLAFAISTMIAPDILFLDEWIGAGDAHFNDKAKARMDTLVERSRGLIIASHNVGLMKSLCTRGLVLQKGKLIFNGPIDESLERYKQLDRH